MKTGIISNISPIGTSHDPNILKRVLFRNGEIPHITQISETVFTPGQRVEKHTHVDMYELFICTAGLGEIRSGDKVHQLRAGTYVLCEPGDEHDVINTGEGNLVLTTIGIVQ